MRWRKSSRSGSNNNCVEVAYAADDSVHVRDSKDPNGRTLHFTEAEWWAFIAGAKAGEFDQP